MKPRTALITGSGKNIGRAIALRLARNGFNVVVHGGSDRVACEAVAEAVRACGVDALVTVGDVGNRKEVYRIAEAALAEFGTIDILIHNAAIRPHQDFFTITDDEWDRVLEVNLGAAFQFSQLLLPGMLKQQWGRIVTFAGVNAIRGYPNSVHVSVSKHGAWGFVKALSRDFADQGITANTISPGAILTERDDQDLDDFIRKQAAAVPAKRLGTPEEIAGMVAHLLSDEGGYITGQLLQINGGGAM
ncbi:MAG TPA: SDR family oxidoreductase [Candidatus Lambdaproteobacteria bacterium]|nr:SDR family oxidoreductase [Candidatus Lambdaproteobacteria bacterium]